VDYLGSPRREPLNGCVCYLLTYLNPFESRVHCPNDYTTRPYRKGECYFWLQSHLLPLSLAELNSGHFVPKKDYTVNRLRAGVLQLSANTHLLVDETAMQPGQLDANG